MKKILIIQVAGLGFDFAEAHGLDEVAGIRAGAADGMFPGLTCSVQAGFRTGLNVAGHGMPGNGYFDRTLRKSYFWEQSSALVQGPRIWDGLPERGMRVAMLFWQQSLGESADFVVSPAPVHRHHGGIIENTYSKPGDLYARLRAAVGSDFKLRDYWGPLASVKASRWIADATAALIADTALSPDVCFTYLPALDYDLQRYGPESGKAAAAARALKEQLEGLAGIAAENGYDIVFFGDYAIGRVTRALFPNRVLADEGFLKINRIGGMQYPDMHESRAFCLVDHEIGHVYIKDQADIGPVRNLLAGMDGVDAVMDRAAQKAAGVDCERSGDLIIVAGDSSWLAYPWWTQNSEAPEYAGHVDIHNKPGYDPCELFFGWPPGRTGMNTDRIRGSHGRIGADRRIAWGSTIEFDASAANLIELSQGVKEFMHNRREG